MNLAKLPVVIGAIMVAVLLVTGPMVLAVGSFGGGTPDREETITTETNLNENIGVKADFYRSASAMNGKQGTIPSLATKTPIIMSDRVIVWSDGSGQYVGSVGTDEIGTISGITSYRFGTGSVTLTKSSGTQTINGLTWAYTYNPDGTARMSTDGFYTQVLSNVYFAGGNSVYYSSGYNTTINSYKLVTSNYSLEKINSVSVTNGNNTISMNAIGISTDRTENTSGVKANFYNSASSMNGKTGNITSMATKTPIVLTDKAVVFSDGSGWYTGAVGSENFGALTGVTAYSFGSGSLTLTKSGGNVTVPGISWAFTYSASGTARIGTTGLFTDDLANVYYAGGNADYFGSGRNTTANVWELTERTYDITKITNVTATNGTKNVTMSAYGVNENLEENSSIGYKANFYNSASSMNGKTGNITSMATKTPIVLTDKAVVFSDGTGWYTGAVGSENFGALTGVTAYSFGSGTLTLTKSGGNVTVPGISWAFTYNASGTAKIFGSGNFYIDDLAKLYYAYGDSEVFVSGNNTTTDGYTMAPGSGSGGDSYIKITNATQTVNGTTITPDVFAIDGFYDPEINPDGIRASNIEDVVGSTFTLDPNTTDRTPFLVGNFGIVYSDGTYISLKMDSYLISTYGTVEEIEIVQGSPNIYINYTGDNPTPPTILENAQGFIKNNSGDSTIITTLPTVENIEQFYYYKWSSQVDNVTWGTYNTGRYVLTGEDPMLGTILQTRTYTPSISYENVESSGPPVVSVESFTSTISKTTESLPDMPIVSALSGSTATISKTFQTFPAPGTITSVTGTVSGTVTEIDDYYRVSDKKVTFGSDVLNMAVYGLTEEFILTETETIIIPGTEGKYDEYKTIIAIVPVVCMSLILLYSAYSIRLKK